MTAANRIVKRLASFVTSPVTAVGASGGSAFDPLQLDGLQLWLDASDTDTVLHATDPVVASDGETVRRWLDKSGNDRHADQTIGSEQPLFDADGLNGKGVLTFDGSNDHLSSGTNSTWNFLHDGTESLVVIVAKAGSSADPDALHTFVGTGAETANTGVHVSYEDRALASYNDFIRSAVVGGVRGQPACDTNTIDDTMLPQTYYIIEVSLDADNSTAENRAINTLNGVTTKGNVETNPPSTSNSTFPLNIGQWGGGGFLDGAIAEVIICNDPNTANRSNLRNYLASKWGITLA